MPRKKFNSCKKWFFLDLVTTKKWSSCTGLSFLGSLVGCIFQSVLWQNVTFIPLCKIWTTLIPCLKTIFLKTFSSLVSFLLHFVYLQPGLIRLFLKKTFSWQELLFLCHFRCRFITTSTLVESTILGKVLLCFGKICPPAFLYFLRVS